MQKHAPPPKKKDIYPESAGVWHGVRVMLVVSPPYPGGRGLATDRPAQTRSRASLMCLMHRPVRRMRSGPGPGRLLGREVRGASTARSRPLGRLKLRGLLHHPDLTCCFLSGVPLGSAAAVGSPPTAVCFPPTAVGFLPTAAGFPPTAVGFLPTALGYPTTAVGHRPNTTEGPVIHFLFCLSVISLI